MSLVLNWHNLVQSQKTLNMNEFSPDSDALVTALGPELT